MKTFREDVTSEREVRLYMRPPWYQVVLLIASTCFCMFAWYQALVLQLGPLAYFGAISLTAPTVLQYMAARGLFISYSLYCAYDATGDLLKTYVMRRGADINEVSWSNASLLVEFPLNGAQYKAYQQASTGEWEEAPRHCDMRICLDVSRLRLLEPSYPIGVPEVVRLESQRFQSGPSMGCVYFSLRSIPWLRDYLVEYPESATRLFYNDFTIWIKTLITFAGRGRSAFELIVEVIDQLADTSRLGKSKEGMRLRAELTQRALEIVPIEYGELHARLTAQQRKISDHQSAGKN